MQGLWGLAVDMGVLQLCCNTTKKAGGLSTLNCLFQGSEDLVGRVYGLGIRANTHSWSQR